MNRLVPLLLPLALAACMKAEAAASAAPPTSQASPAPSAVNPLTGQPVAFEATQRRLEQMRLETQLLEEEAKQAAIRNNMSLAPMRRGNEERRLQTEMFGPAGAGTSGVTMAGAATGASGSAPVTRSPRRPERQPPPVRTALREPAPVALPAPATSAAFPAQTPQVMAILRNGDQRRAIVQWGTTSTTVSEGDKWMGRRIGAITEGAVTIDGATVELPRHPAVIVASDRRPPPGQPMLVQQNRAQPSMASPPAQISGGTVTGASAAASAQPFPPLPPLPAAVPVIGPVDPRNPLSALGPQPAGLSPLPPRPVPMPTVPATDGLR